MASAGTAYVDIEAKLDSLASDVDAAVAAIDTQTVDIEAVADTSDAQAEIDGIEGGSAEINVEANTEQAQEQISGLGDVAQGALGGLGGLGGAAGGAASALGKTAVAGAGAAAGLFEFAQAAIDAESASQRFDLITGDLADQVGSIDVGGLSGDIGDLALQLGSSDEAMLNATASFVSFAESTGASDEQIVAASDNINALALRAVALNPALGDAGAVAERMTNALARGGRATTQFGIGLTSAEINARAMADTGKQNTNELTQFEKAAAGAEIAVERLGNTMGTDFQQGSQNARTEWNRMTESLGEAAETAGGVMLPAIENITEAVTELGSGVANLSPRDWLSGLWDLSGGLIANGFTDLWGAVGLGEDTLRGVGTLVGELPPALRDTDTAAEEAAAGLDDFGQSIDEYLTGLFSLPDAQREARQAISELADAVSTGTWDDQAVAMENVVGATAKVITTQQNLGASQQELDTTIYAQIAALAHARDQGRITGDQFDTLAAQIAGIPHQSITPVSAPGAVQAKDQVEDLTRGLKGLPPYAWSHVQAMGAATANSELDHMKRMLDEIDGKHATSYVGVVTTGSAKASARGGPLDAGELSLVGEEGPELFVPNTGGNVVDAARTASVMLGAGKATAPVQHFHFPHYLGDHSEIARAVSDALRKLERAAR